MHVLSATGPLSSRKLSSPYFDVSRITPEPQSSFSSTYNASQRSYRLKRGDSETMLTNIIEEKVTSLKTKFGELSGLRKRLIDSNIGSSEDKLSNTMKARIRSFDSNKLMNTKKREIMQGKIFVSEDRRSNITQITEAPSDTHEKESRRCYYNPNFDKLLFDPPTTEGKKYLENNECNLLKDEIELLKSKLESTKLELKDSERMRVLQESTINTQQKDLKYSQDKVQLLSETNKSLRLEVNRLERRMKNIDDKKCTNSTAIRNLSYIILSKDSPNKDSPSKSEASNGIALKYLDALNELHNSDQFIMTILSCLKNNHANEAYKMILEVQESLIERIEKTRANVEQLENIVYECKSPLLSPQKSMATEEKGNEKEKSRQTCINANDYISFMKCEASMLEELLMVT